MSETITQQTVDKNIALTCLDCRKTFKPSQLSLRMENEETAFCEVSGLFHRFESDDIEQPPTEPRAGDRCVKCGVTDELQQGLCPECYGDAPTNPRARERSRAENCEDCGAPTSFERRDPKTQPPEGEVCEQCQRWVCPDCVHSIGEPCPPEQTNPRAQTATPWNTPQGYLTEIEKLSERNTKLVAALRALRNNIDVSTINNSKRSTAKWTELIDLADAALANDPEGE